MKISDLADTSHRDFPLQEPIAIIGIGCRYSGNINNLDDFWKVLIERKSTLKEVPADRFPDIEALHDADRGYRKIVSRQGGWLEHLKDFDAKFFKISPREAEKVDPHQRLMLEVTFEAFEDAGLKLEDVWGTRTGVYAGMWSSDFEHVLTNSKDDIDVYSTTGSGRYAAAGRLAYYFNLQGPTFTLDTACSTSLVAVHLASQSLHLKECDLAVCSAANLILDPFISIGYSRSRLLSDYGKCRFGAKDASGYVRTEGAATVVLKRLSDAQKDGDHIYGVIPGSACNSDGQSHKHMLAPSAITQEIMIKDALSRAHLSPSLVQYVEAHGTGTKAGDPAEIASISEALAKDRKKEDKFYVGSIKTNLGHTEAASGVAGLIKIILSIQNKIIPGNLYADEEKNPNIPWEELSLEIPYEPKPWPHPERPLLAGLNSFGISGTNAHVLIQEPPKSTRESHTYQREIKLLPVSAANDKTLKVYAEKYLELVKKTASDAELLNLVKNIAIRKADLPQRAVILFRTKEELIQGLSALQSGKTAENVFTGYNEDKKRTALVFPGQGAQWNGMGKQLYDSEPVFRNAIDECEQAFSKYTTWSLTDELFAADGMKHIDIIQPALIAVEIALAKWWQSIGLDFKAVIGHSMGEVGAAYIAGHISLDEAANIICTRSHLMKETSGKGAMGYIATPPAEVLQRIQGREQVIGIGVNNSPSSCVVSGQPDAVDQILSEFEQAGAFTRRIKVDVASHSPQMDPLLDRLAAALSTLDPKTSQTEFYSTVSADLLTGKDLGAAYWTRNLRNTVRFADTLQLMVNEGYGHFVEVSPHPTLLQAINENAEFLNTDLNVAGSIEREKDEINALLRQVAIYFVNGGRISWKKFYGTDFSKVTLPAYPWQRERYWVEEGSATTQRHSNLRKDGKVGHPLLMHKLVMPQGSDVHIWESDINLTTFPYLSDHLIQETIVVPGAAYIEMFLAAAEELAGPGKHLLQDIDLRQALPVKEGQNILTQVILTRSIADTYQCSIYSLQGDDEQTEWTEHASATLYLNGSTARMLPNSLPVDVVEAVVHTAITSEEHYQQTASIALPYGPAFQTVQQLKTGENFILADVQATSKVLNATNRYFLHPAILDGCIQAYLSAVYTDQDKGTFVPVSVGKLLLHNYGKSINACTAVIKLTADNYDRLTGNAVVYDKEGEAILEMRDFSLDRLEQQAGKEEGLEQLLYHVVQEPAELPATTEKKILLFASDKENGHLIEVLQPAFIVRKGNFYASADNEFIIDPKEQEDYIQLARAVSSQIDTVVHAWNLDETAVEGFSSAHNTSLSIVRLIQAFAAEEQSARLWVLSGNTEQYPAQATATGMLNVIRNEHPEWKASSIDNHTGDWLKVSRIIHSNTQENTWTITEDAITVARLRHPESVSDIPAEQQLIPAHHQPFEVVTDEPGILENLVIREKTLIPPAPHEVHVEVKALGINFMNLMSALGIYPGKVNGFATLGIECAGVVKAAGSDVTHLQVGDSIFGMAYHTMATDINVDASLMQLMPENMSFEEAATIPVVFLTVYYGLVVQARLKAGERVLIHAATGGVGLAAIQMAQLIGAEIYATAGSHEKRELLKSMGIRYVYDSRSLDFADRIMQDTSEEGIDVVLNSLTGSAMVKSLELLRSFGRFVEIGKKDVYANSKIGLEAFTKGLSYFMIDFEKMIFEKPGLVGELLGELLPFFESGDLLPLEKKVFPVAQAKAAFEYMSGGKHIGKIVVKIDREGVFLEKGIVHHFSPDATYLITGGYGGLGLTFARHLTEQGARRLILTGRTGVSNHPDIDQLRSQGVEVIIEKADAANREDIERILLENNRSEQPLKGVFNLAGILEDASVLNIEEDAFLRVLAPKAAGAYNLHEATQHLDLDHFVLFSSSTILFGSPGQAAYVAANAYMDALAAYRIAKGLPALSVQWGTVSEVGLAAAAGNRADRLTEEGVAPLSPEECTQLYDLAASYEEAIIGAFRFDLERWEKAYPAAHSNPFYALLRNSEDVTAFSSAEESRSFRDLLSDISDPEQRVTAIEQALREKVGMVVKLDPEEINNKTPFKSLGIDSLMSIQLKNQLEKTFDMTLSVTSFWTHSNIREYTKFLLDKLQLSAPAMAAAPVAEKIKEPVKEIQTQAQPAAEISVETIINDDDLSLDDLSKLLEDELNDLD